MGNMLDPCHPTLHTGRLTRMGHFRGVPGFQLGQRMGFLPWLSPWKITLDWLYPLTTSHSCSPNDHTYMMPSMIAVNTPFPCLPRSGVGTILQVLGYGTDPCGPRKLPLTYGSGPFTKSPGMPLMWMRRLCCLRTLTETVWLQVPDEALNPGSTAAM